MKEFGKLKTGPGGKFCTCCSPAIGNFGRHQRNHTKTLTRRYLRRTVNKTIFAFELD